MSRFQATFREKSFLHAPWEAPPGRSSCRSRNPFSRKQGFHAVAPELYARIGNPAALTDIKAVVALVNQAPDRQAWSDLDRTIAWAAGEGGDATRVGITGWCRGGRMVWMYASHNPALKAGVAWYGPLGGTPSAAMPTTPLDVAGTIRVPILGLYGGQDQGIPQSDIAEMERRLKASGEACRFVVYPDAGHGFNADYRESYNAADAADGFAQCIAWLHEHGVR